MSDTPAASFSVGDAVRVAALPPYLKTADTMPMLRPPNLIAVGEQGLVMAKKSGGYWSVRFERGTFLIEATYLEAIAPNGESTESDPNPAIETHSANNNPEGETN